jgi:HD-like signal output (HDOD) protein/prolyl-tRNA editing enzyme YbaK/EbsC (Cys-tRNA(Pro) deacylase)
LEKKHVNTLPAKVQKFLFERQANFRVISSDPAASFETLVSSFTADAGVLVRAVLLRSESNFLLVVLPFNHAIDFSIIKKVYASDYHLASRDESDVRFAECDSQTLPVVGEAYGIETVVEESLFKQAKLLFQPGRRNCLVEMSVSEFRKLFRHSRIIRFSENVSRITQARPEENGEQSGSRKQASLFDRYMPAADVRKRLDQIYSLPTMPQTAVRVMQIRNDPESTVDDLAACIELDPSLAAQVVRYARSPFFGYRGEINTIRDAVHKVLGFGMVTNIAFGLASGSKFRNPLDGPLGLTAFWKHAVFSAAISQELARRIPKNRRPDLGGVYLAALLHNFGFLLLGHLFRPEFFLLNKLIEANPELPVTELEYQVLGMGNAQKVISMGHARLGAWLMYSWKMPDEVIVTIAEHHNEDYDGIHSDYSGLVLLSDRLLAGQGLGDGESAVLPSAVLDRLELSESLAQEVLEKVFKAEESLNAMVSQIISG